MLALRRPPDPDQHIDIGMKSEVFGRGRLFIVAEEVLGGLTALPIN